MADPPGGMEVDASSANGTSALQHELEQLRAQSTRQQLEAEQALHDLTGQLTTLEGQLNEEKQRADQANVVAEQERAKCVGLESQLEQLKQNGDEQAQLTRQRQHDQEQHDKEKRELLQVVERAQQDNQALQESLDSLRTLHTSLQTSHSSLEASLAETTSTSRTSLLRLQTLESTIASLEADKAFLTTELDRGRQEWAAHRRETHDQLVRVQAELDQSQIDQRNAQFSLESLRTSHQALKARHEDTLAQLANTREELEASQGNFASEMSSMKRLVEMMDKREEDRRKRVDDVERGLEDERAAMHEREEQLREELEQEREKYDNLETRYAEMREALERGASSAGRAASPYVDGPGTPSPAGSGFALSPSAQLAVRGQKSGRSYAEVYAEYVRMEEELISERAETKRLSDCLAQILGDIEERAPLLKEQRMEYERLTVESTHLASQLAQAVADREDSIRRTEASRLDVDRLERDNTLLTAQLRDLGRQVRILARSLASAQGNVAEGNADDFDEEEAAILRRAETDATTDAIVSAHLVTFNTINELQVQNQKLLRITREMGAQMEAREEDAIGRRRDLENKAVEEAHELILRLKDEIEAQRLKTDAFERERDMFRRMLAQRGEGSGPSVSGSNGAHADRGHIVDTDTPRLLADVQANFDAYKNEIAVDSQRLRDDLKEAQQAANVARTELAKSKAQAEYTSERLKLLTDTYELQQTEMAQMSKRALQLQQNAAKQEMSNHKMSEELLELRGQTEQLRHENTNLRSEREVGKSVEKRLVEENAALSKERAHLADLMRNLQTMQNELERTGSDSRRRLEEQVNRLEAAAAEMRERLAQESNASRQLALRKELEAKSYQDRIDKLTAEHATTREELIAAKTSQTHLELRVADLQLQVTTREEKLAIFEGRGTGANGEDPSRSVEEQLQVTVADLRAELRTVKSELERATANVQQFKDIAEAEGTALAELTATYDTYKTSTDAEKAEKESEIASLRERLHSLTADVTTTSNQNSELHRQLEAERVAFEKERKLLEDGMANLRNGDQTAREAQLAAQEELRRQVQLAKEAHEKYERELVAHAEDVKRLSEVKGELETVRQSIGEQQTAAEVAKANLLSSEESWSRQKHVLEQELADVRKRCDDLTGQNAVLHEHLESFSTRAAKIQAQQTAPEQTGEGETASTDAAATSHDGSVEQLRQVIKYIRGEKDIVDFQLELAKQETARLRTQLDFTTRNLEETRQALTEERSKSGETSVSSAQHAELLERIHTAKLLRESNQTLRDENEAHLRKIAQLDTRVRELSAQLEPLKEQVQTLQAEVEAKEHNIKLLQEDNERWKQRNQTILAKYERIDPEELQVLKNEVETVKAQLTEKEAQLAEKEAEKTAVQTQLDDQTKLTKSMEENWTNSKERFRALQVQARNHRDQNQALSTEVAELKTKMETASAEATTQAEQAVLQQRITALESEKATLEARLKEFESGLDARIQQQTTALQMQLEELEQKRAELEQSAKESETKLTSQLEAVEKERARLQSREKPLYEDNKRMRAQEMAVRASKAALEAQQQELETLKTKLRGDNAEAIEVLVKERVAAIETAPTPSDAAIEETVREKVAAAQATLDSTREAAIAEAVTKATAPLEQQLEEVRKQLAAASEATATASTASTEAANAELTKLKDEFESTKKAMEAEFEKVKERLAQESKKREQDITERLSAEIKKAQEEAAASVAAAAAAAEANSSAAPKDATPAPAVDVEALVTARLEKMQADQAESQRKAIEEAVAKAVKEAVQQQETLAATKLQQQKEASVKESEMKNSLLRNQLKSTQAKLKALQEGTTATATATGATPPTTTAGTAAGSASATATRGARGGRGGVVVRGGRGAGQVGRGGKAQTGAATPPADASKATAEPSGPPAISLRGAASARPSPGGVVGALLGNANAIKRQREDESSSAAGAPADGTKRQKPEK